MIPLLLAATVAFQVDADTLRFSGRDAQLAVRAPRIESPSIAIDADLDEPEWAGASVLTGFTQYTPIEGAEASQDTEVRVFYSPDAIYFGLHVFDSEPDRILAHLLERDRSQSDDWVRIVLDTFDDERQAYTFFVSPYGIQSDGLWLESLVPLGGPTGPKVDFNPDFIWDSSGKIVADGWVAEVRIPYVSLRFPDAEVQNWGLQIARGVMRNNFKSSWAPLTMEVSSILAQSGRLEGLRGLRPKRLFEVNPVATGKVEGTRGPTSFDRGNPKPEFGLNARLGLSQNLVLDGTANPDFSQVEADADQVQVNERFALFFPEKRVFFLEGVEIFRSTQRLVHTRRIVDPIAGAKVTGKVGQFNVAYLGSVDESPSSVFGGEGDAVFNLVRASRDIGTGSSVGLLYTDRTLTQGGGSNRVLSADTRLLFSGRYSLETQLTGSWTSSGAGDQPGMKPALTLSFARSGLAFRYAAKLDDLDPGFRALAGFMPRVGDTELSGSMGFDLFGARSALVERSGLEVRAASFFDHDDFWEGGSPFEWEVTLSPTVAFRGARSLTFGFRLGGFRFQPEDYADYTVAVDGPIVVSPPRLPPFPALDGLWGWSINPNWRINPQARLMGRASFGEVPIFAEGSRGWETRLSPSLQVQPNDALNLNVSYTWARLHRRADDSVFSTASLPRLQLQYQFSRYIFTRLIGQYDLEERDALYHPVTGEPIGIAGLRQSARERGNFQGQVLLSYEPSPGTVFFLGYSRVMDGPYGYRLGEKDLLQDGFFMKLSYLLRM